MRCDAACLVALDSCVQITALRRCESETDRRYDRYVDGVGGETRGVHVRVGDSLYEVVPCSQQAVPRDHSHRFGSAIRIATGWYSVHRPATGAIALLKPGNPKSKPAMALSCDRALDRRGVCWCTCYEPQSRFRLKRLWGWCLSFRFGEPCNMGHISRIKSQCCISRSCRIEM